VGGRGLDCNAWCAWAARQAKLNICSFELLDLITSISHASRGFLLRSVNRSVGACSATAALQAVSRTSPHLYWLPI
jgi:hypothetical protein